MDFFLSVNYNVGVPKRERLHFIFEKNSMMAINEASERCQIPIEILKKYGGWGLTWTRPSWTKPASRTAKS